MSVEVLPSPPAPARTTRRPSARERLTRQLLRVVAGRVPVDILLPDDTLLPPLPRARGRRDHTGGATDRPRLRLIEPDAFVRRLARDPKVGIGEGYTAGEWAAEPGTDLAAALIPFAERLTDVLPAWLLRLRRLVDRPIPEDQHGALEHSQANVAAHYDLSNDLFAAFLDDSLTYSSALFDDSRPLAEQDLTDAQLRKVHAALDLAGVGPGTDLVEIGTGWGTLAIEAARRGATVTSVTLSVEQADLARQRIDAAGLSGRVKVIVQDYREVTGDYDAVVSIEMIEAVGERFWPDYFGTLSRLVRPGGAVVLQSILMSHERYLATRHSYGWIQKHIFPGGLVPSLPAIEQHAEVAGLRVARQHAFGTDYAETLHRWRARFLAAWPTIRSDLFGDEFARTWEFYLAYCEAGFRTGYLDVAQLRLEPTG
ncbi:SAM-dependent methyltransferase [Nocardioides limicola]|uniref:SAM-dependent methyltransferase n=1 Tax=Nocardioides limicola TaxID=2803368 RepID=UPI00193C00CC|nr:cyclopropane-fatty-acyl-phospholipid synthase family protein [Nocardioides sp. DJM-14]